MVESCSINCFFDVLAKPQVSHNYLKHTARGCLKIDFFLAQGRLTRAVAVRILVPPEAPTTIRTSPLASTTIVGVIEERDRFPGAILLASEGGSPK